MAAGLAQLAAEHGKRVLVCETDAKGDVPALFEAPATDFTPKEIAPGIWSLSMDTEASLREYLKLHLRIPVVGRIGPLAKAFDFVATAAPGVREILTVGKFAGRSRSTTTTSSWSTRPPPATSSGSWRRRRPSTTSSRSGSSAARPTGCSTSSPTRVRPGSWPSARPRRCRSTRHSSWRRGARGDDRPPVGGRGQPRAARAVHPARRGVVRTAARARERGAAVRARRRLGRPGARGGPPGRHAAADALGAPAAPPGGAPQGRPRPVAALPVHAQLRCANDPAGGDALGEELGL